MQERLNSLAELHGKHGSVNALHEFFYNHMATSPSEDLLCSDEDVYFEAEGVELVGEVTESPHSASESLSPGHFWSQWKDKKIIPEAVGSVRTIYGCRGSELLRR